MINKKVENFLEHTNMNYMYCLLSNLEVARLNSLPPYVKQKFGKKITVLAMDHIAENDIPDYIMDIEEARAEMERLGLTTEEFEAGLEGENFEDEEELEMDLAPEDFQDDKYTPFSEDNYDEDMDDEDIADNDED